MRNLLLTAAIVLNQYFLLAQNTSTFTDPRDGRNYEIIQLGDSWWFTSNLRYKTPGAMTFLRSDSSEENFYPWTELDQLCPAGWRLPSENDWKKVFELIDGDSARNVRLINGVPIEAEISLWNGGPLKLVPVGWVEGGKFKRDNETLSLWIKSAADHRTHLHIKKASFILHTHKQYMKPRQEQYFRLFSARCVKDAE